MKVINMINIFKTKHFKCLILTAIIAVCLSFISCSNNISSVDDIVFPDSNVSYLNQVQPYIKLTCAYANCHNSFDLAYNLSLDNYFDLTSAMSSAMVRPGNPDGSILIQMLEGKTIHSDYRYFKINDNQKKGLRTWIKEGAKNN
jgi:hypothetical protein